MAAQMLNPERYRFLRRWTLLTISHWAPTVHRRSRGGDPASRPQILHTQKKVK